MTIFSPKKKIEYILAEILNSQGLIDINSCLPLKLFLVEINAKNFTNNITYKSPLCLQIAKFYEESPYFIAKNILNLWTNLEHISALDIQVKISGNGWLEFIIGNHFLINWLQELPKLKLPFLSTPLRENKLDFWLYYAHIRCCSILRLAHQEKLIQLKSIDFNSCLWQWHKPKLIPYHCGCLNSEYEKKLIYQLIIIVDAIYEQKESDWWKLALEFDKVILDFERYCRIFGEINRQQPQLSQARLGLIALAQFYLQWILQQKLEAITPTQW